MLDDFKKIKETFYIILIGMLGLISKLSELYQYEYKLDRDKIL